MVLTINSRVFADAQIQGITLHPLVGAYELRFALLIAVGVTPEGEHCCVVIDGARVRMGTGGSDRDDLGFARPDRQIEIVTGPHPCFRPLHRVAAWMSGQGLPISPGTLANSLKRFVPLFEPVAEAILAHQNEAALRHADETGWRVQELRGEDRSSRAWLWTSVSSDAVSYRGRDAGCPAPPAQIRTGPLGHPAPPLGSAPHSADGKSLVRPRVSDFQLGPMGLGQCRDIGPCRAVLLRP